ncbi:hypothetical protein [Curtobacterium pusillum]|uniref:hypothetical protein n=1 Tax=Curtobacterium pusillum TaxID=69373 RepID=UPI00119ED0E8|nr:hypothetical protein [Curtobacterium pusillum]
MPILIKHIVSVVTVLMIIGGVAGCAGGSMQTHPTQKPEDAKRGIVELVDAATEALGGEWDVIDGPRLGTCVNERGEGEGVDYAYMKRRTERGDAERDIITLERLWSARGLETKRFSSGRGALIGISARGEGASSIGYSSSDLGGGDTVSGTSPCAAGDLVEMRERGEE